MSQRLQDADAGYVRLAYAILVQAISDAVAPLCTWRTDAVLPSAADVRSAREFLASPAAHWLAARLGLSLEDVLRQLNTLAGETPQPDEWLSLRQAAQLLGCRPEYLRRLIHRGQVTARRGRGGRWLVARRVVLTRIRPPGVRGAEALERQPPPRPFAWTGQGGEGPPPRPQRVGANDHSPVQGAWGEGRT